MNGERKTVVIAGATGFVGRALVRELGSDFRVIGLSRGEAPAGLVGEWRRCDLFSLLQTEQALAGADTAFYLVHSMLPSARLTQGSFENLDLIIADNFARAAARAGIRHIIYLGGLVPCNEPHLSRHLRSRLEVEETLGGRSIPLTALRAGIIIGAEGSSFRMLLRVAQRLPIVPCPERSRSLTQPVAIADVIRLLRHCLEHPAAQNRTIDIGSPDVLSYHDLLGRIAAALGKKRLLFYVPGTRWCKPWLSLVSNTPLALVSPLLESMQHSLTACDLRPQQEAGVPGLPLDEALHAAMAAGSPASPRRRRPKGGGHDVRSVQRIPLPAGKTARWLAEEYTAWLPRLFRSFLKARSDGSGSLFLSLRFPPLLLLELSFAKERSVLSDRQLFYITGGLLARRVERATQRPRLEFREVLKGGCALVAIHDYRPTLPWPLYNLTQAQAHLWVMRRFARHIQNRAP